MKKYHIFFRFVLIIILLLPGSALAASGNNNGVDDLRGRWDVQWQLESEGPEMLPELEVLVTEIEPSPTQPSVYLATGCMAIVDEGFYAPLSLQVTDHQDGSYNVIFLSTVIPGVNDMGVFIVRFEGILDVYGQGVTDDVIGGDVLTSFSPGTWTGIHHDRRRVKCPAADPSVLYFSPDLYMERDRSPGDFRGDTTLFGGSTNIVSSAMRVEIPDGRVVVAEYEQDIFTLADFITEFAFGLNLWETPIVGEPYKFTLLDNLGNPIPGTETTDYWFSCPQSAPTNPFAIYEFEDYVNLSWTGVDDVPGQFEPNGDPQIGFYQIELNPFEEGVMLYGMNIGSSTYHNIPWNPFVSDETEGDPDGFDRGISLSELGDGRYEYRILSFSESHRDNPGFGLECQSVISADNLLMDKSGSDLSFIRFGSISGIVTDEDDSPLAGIEVTACEYDNEDEPYCRGGQTDENGEYVILQLFDNDYRVFIDGQAGWVNEFYNDTVFYDAAERVVVQEGLTTLDINFNLAQAGSVSGTVFDEFGNPLGGIAVDTEEGGYGTCTDENGFYVLNGVPYGTYNIVAGRDFCDPHSYAESTVYDVTLDSDIPDISDVDFTLVMGSDPPAQYLNVQPDHMWADSGGWTEGVEVTLSFDGYSVSEFASPDGNLWFDLTDTGISSGMDVNVTDGVNSKDLHVANASFGGVDDAENTAWGTAPADMGLGIAVVDENGNEDGFYWVDGIQADGSGNWFVDFDDYGQDFGPVIDAWVHVFDEDGDSTLAHLQIEEPPQINIVAHPDHEWVSSHGWMIGDEITMYIDDDNDLANGYLLSMTQFAVEQGWDPGVGDVWFDQWATFDLAPGMFVTLQGESFTGILQVEAHSVDSFDEVGDTVSGTAPPNRDVGVGVHQPDGYFWLVVISDSNGDWTADFGAEGYDMLDVFDIHSMIWDEDGDATQANYNFPPP